MLASFGIAALPAVRSPLAIAFDGARVEPGHTRANASATLAAAAGRFRFPVPASPLARTPVGA
jgi:hypothetical protein